MFHRLTLQLWGYIFIFYTTLVSGLILQYLSSQDEKDAIRSLDLLYRRVEVCAYFQLFKLPLIFTNNGGI